MYSSELVLRSPYVYDNTFILSFNLLSKIVFSPKYNHSLMLILTSRLKDNNLKNNLRLKVEKSFLFQKPRLLPNNFAKAPNVQLEFETTEDQGKIILKYLLPSSFLSSVSC